MAGLYVPGVKKPYGCDFCPWYRTLWSFCTAANKDISVLDMNKGPDWCPLVEVPDHGDLIDRDEWRKSLIDEGETIGIDGFSIDGLTADDVCYAIENAPVVIPAEREER